MDPGTRALLLTRPVGSAEMQDAAVEQHHVPRFWFEWVVSEFRDATGIMGTLRQTNESQPRHGMAASMHGAMLTAFTGKCRTHLRREVG